MNLPTLRFHCLFSIACVVLICGCTARNTQPNNDELNQSVDDVISRLGLTLPGSYGNFAQHRLDNNIPELQLLITRQNASGQFLVEQLSNQANIPKREFIWQFTRTVTAELQLEFAPIINGAAAQSCQVILLPVDEGISGSTKQQECRLPNRENQPIGLLKEFLLNPDQIALGERLYNLETNTPLGADTKLDFYRQHHYKGWAGKQNPDTGEWLLAQPFELHNQGDDVLIIDNADRSLGYRIELAQIIYRTDQPEVLRLSVIDEDTDKQIAYAWADGSAQRIGINLEWLQVGMELVEEESISIE